MTYARPMERMNLFGLPVTVGSKAEIEAAAGDEPVHLVARVADCTADEMPPALRKRRFRVPCSVCREICWCDPQALAVPSATIICLQCLAEYLEPGSQE